jgi:hypothetical protein
LGSGVLLSHPKSRNKNENFTRGNFSIRKY